MRKRRLSVHLVLPGISLAVTLFLFAPVDLYLSSAEDLWFAPEDLALWLGIFSLAAFTVITLLARFLPAKLSVAFRASVYACSFLLYLQGNLLVPDYGRLDGHAVDWSAYTGQYVLDALLWIAVIGLFIFLFFKFKKKFRRIVEIAAGVLLITQLVSLGVFLTRYLTQNTVNIKRYLSVKNEFTVSPESNTVVFVLDAFDSHLFDSLLQEDPERIGADFADFTYYPDTVGGAARTKYAIPYILSGSTNTGELSYVEYRSEVFSSSPLIAELASGAYDTGFFTSKNYIDMSRDDAVGNIAEGRPEPYSRFGLTKQFMKLVAFRYAPSALSRYFWMYTGDFEYWKRGAGKNATYKMNDVTFYRSLTSARLEASAGKPAFRFYHLHGAHTPYTMNEKCGRVSAGKSSEKEQALGSLRIVAEYLSQLKALGLYDRTAVIVLADHGYRAWSNAEQTPLFMVKPAGASHPFVVSDLPLSYASLPEILVSALRGTLSSLEPFRASSPRYFYLFSEKDADVTITEYAVDGPALTVDASETGTVYRENAKHLTREYIPGTVLYFNEKDTARRYFVSGFGRNESSFTWTKDRDAEMLFLLPETPGELVLRMKHSTSNGTQTVEVWVNGQLIETYTANGSAEHSVRIPAGTVTDRELRLRLHLPDAVSPAERGKNTDQRLLALKMKSLVIENAEPDPAGQ